MDDNTRSVLVACVTVLGALGGIGLGALIQGRHRHDDEKRRVYGRMVGLVRQEIWHHTVIFEENGPVEGLSPEYRRDAPETVALVQILSSSRDLGEAGRLLHNALTDWVMGQPYDDATWDTKLDAMGEEINGFIARAKRELKI